MSQDDQETFLEAIKCLVLKGGKFIEEAKALAKAMVESLEPEIHKLSVMQADLEKKENDLLKKAQTSQSVEDVCKLSELELEKEKLSSQITKKVIFYSTVLDELEKLQQFASSQRAPIVVAKASSPSPKGATIASLREKVATLLQRMTAFWTTDSDEDKYCRTSTEDLDIKGRTLRLQISDVRGDGACGWRAFITGAIRVLCGKQLSYDPEGMIKFIFEAKQLLVELVQILLQIPTNQEFITGLMTIPANGGRKNLDTYTSMVLADDYQATNFELRLLCVLFGLVNTQLSQVNIIRKNSLFDEIYQSMSDSGHSLPVTNQQINILHDSGHYNSIVHLTEGVLPRIISPEGAIIIN